ncbi:MAG: TIGR04282 family arsenosugar biosynthesis glycosyltransferase [Hyphomicrobiaceae bacterium]|nr:TIGR04282 family arsenosugar biosynthesis glycosyltransferase [Hyphomicrobiaceae bacterium]
MRAHGFRFEGQASRRRAAPFRSRLVVMTKAPAAGAVKTRLARALGVANATRFARHATAALVQRLARDPRWQTILAVTPDAAASSRCWPRGILRLRQGNGDLGCRMQRIMDTLPPGPVAIIGTDVPGVTPAHIASAFLRLGRYQAVFGRALDGGYWLVGMRRRPRVLEAFANVRWSSEHALNDTLARLRHVTVGFVATLADVDEASAFHAAAGQFGRRVLSRNSGSAPSRAP